MNAPLNLNDLLSRHDLPMIADYLRETLETERANRSKFRDDLSPSVKQEFISGEIVIHSPAKAKHLRATDNLMNLLRNFVHKHSLGDIFTEKALICLTRNDYEPDICFFGREKTATFHGDMMEFPAPDFIVEVLSPSTEKIDRGVKFDDYALHQVREYWIVDCEEQSVEQYILRDGESMYHLQCKVTHGDVASTVISGFTIPVQAIFDAELNRQTLMKMIY